MFLWETTYSTLTVLSPFVVTAGSMKNVDELSWEALSMRMCACALCVLGKLVDTQFLLIFLSDHLQ